jgi:hypothetical protein
VAAAVRSVELPLLPVSVKPQNGSAAGFAGPERRFSAVSDNSSRKIQYAAAGVL